MSRYGRVVKEKVPISYSLQTSPVYVTQLYGRQFTNFLQQRIYSHVNSRSSIKFVTIQIAAVCA
jgi:hypothetical protein